MVGGEAAARHVQFSIRLASFRVEEEYMVCTGNYVAMNHLIGLKQCYCNATLHMPICGAWLHQQRKMLCGNGWQLWLPGLSLWQLQLPQRCRAELQRMCTVTGGRHCAR
jgi:hypothetical protein